MAGEVIYILYTYEFSFLCKFIDSLDFQAQSQVSSKGQLLFILSRANSYISNLDIMEQHRKLPSHTIGVPCLDCISLILVFDNFPLTLKKGECWNLLESTSTRNPFIESSYKWTRMLFIISNSKPGI